MAEDPSPMDRRWPRGRILQVVAAVACAAVAGLFFFVGDGTGYRTGERQADGWRGLVLTWCHLLAWVFASAAFALAATRRIPRLATRLVGLASLASYVVFRAVLHGVL